MFRFLILVVGIVWASLLLISWSSPPETATQPVPAIKVSS
jgi:hypothetical protein